MGTYTFEQSWTLTDSSGATLASGSGTAGTDVSTTVCDGVVTVYTDAPSQEPTSSAVESTACSGFTWGGTNDGFNVAMLGTYYFAG